MIYLLPILALALYVGILRLLGPGQSTVKKGKHYPRIIDTLLLKGALPLRNVWFWGGISGSFVVTQAMVDAVAWTKDGCMGDSSKTIGRGSWFHLPTRGSVRVAHRWAEPEGVFVVHGAAMGRTEMIGRIELMAMGHDPKQGGKMIFESLGTAKVGDDVRVEMWDGGPPTSVQDRLTVVQVQVLPGPFLQNAETRTATLPIDTRFGLSQGHHQGGDCGALNDVTI